MKKVVALLTALIGFAVFVACAVSTEGSNSKLGVYMAAEGPDVQPLAKPGGGTSSGNNASGGTSGTTCLTYWGGPIMTGTPTVHFIWYGNWSGSPGTAAAQPLLEYEVSHLGGTAYWKTNTGYYNAQNQFATGNIAFGQSVFDSYSQGTALTYASLQTIVGAHAGVDLPLDANAIYVIMASPDCTEVGDQTGSTRGFGTDYCAFHNHATINGLDLKFAFLEDPLNYIGGCAWWTYSTGGVDQGPNGDWRAEALTSILSHELNEAITDPDPLTNAAWAIQADAGGESADQCSRNFGANAVKTDANGKLYNVILGTKEYLLQTLQKNGGSCPCALK